MFSTDGILGRSFAFNTAALEGLAKRQELHARNLANIDTPGYRAQTIDFESVLQAELKTPNPGNRFGGPVGVGDARFSGSLASRFSVTARGGKPGVDRTKEVSAMMNDNIRFRVLTQQVTNQLSSVRSVIAEMGRG